MEVAYGAGDGDDDAKAIVARASLDGCSLRANLSRPWNGELGPRWVRNYAIFRHHVYGIFRGKGHRHYNPFVRLSILVIFPTSLTPIAMIFLSVTISGGEGSDWLNRMWGVNRYNLWGQVLGYFPRNLCMWPLLTALVVGGMISDDRKNGTSAIYFSRPVTRADYTAMKYLSSAVVLGFVMYFHMLYYTSAIVFNGEGWAYLIDTLPIFLGGLIAGILLVITTLQLAWLYQALARVASLRLAS